MQRENESWPACDQPIHEENEFDKKKAEETYVGLVGLFLQEKMPILVTYHPRNGSPEEWNEKQSISALQRLLFYVNVNAVTW